MSSELDSALLSSSHPRERTILVVDDEPHVLETVSGWLRQAAWQVTCTRTASAALGAARDPSLTLALIDYRLQGADQGIRLGHVIQRRYGVPFVLFSGHLNTNVVVAAVQAGALDVMDKPLTETRLVSNLQRLLASGGPRFKRRASDAIPPASVEEAGRDLRPTANRWARLVLKACLAPEDPRRVPDWAAASGTSEGMIDEICRLCDVSCRDSRDLARILRAIYVARSTKDPIWTHLTVSDERTLNALLARAAITRTTRTVELRDFFRNQTFVPTSKLCLRELAHVAANSSLFF